MIWFFFFCFFVFVFFFFKFSYCKRVEWKGDNFGTKCVLNGHVRCLPSKTMGMWTEGPKWNKCTTSGGSTKN
jgi:hypothetical protein